MRRTEPSLTLVRSRTLVITILFHLDKPHQICKSPIVSDALGLFLYFVMFLATPSPLWCYFPYIFLKSLCQACSITSLYHLPFSVSPTAHTFSLSLLHILSLFPYYTNSSHCPHLTYFSMWVLFYVIPSFPYFGGIFSRKFI